MISAVTFGHKSINTLQKRYEAKNSLITAEKVLRETQNKYGRPKSYTYLMHKVFNHRDDLLYAEACYYAKNKALKHKRHMQLFPLSKVNHSLFPNKVQSYGDCAECAKLIQKELWHKYNRPSVNVVMDVKRYPKGKFNHVFNLSNIKPNMDLSDVRSWDKDVIITDLWSGIALKKEDAFEHYHRTFNINPFIDIISFDAMVDWDNSLQYKFLEQYNIPKNKLNEMIYGED